MASERKSKALIPLLPPATIWVDEMVTALYGDPKGTTLEVRDLLVQRVRTDSNDLILSPHSNCPRDAFGDRDPAPGIPKTLRLGVVEKGTRHMAELTVNEFGGRWTSELRLIFIGSSPPTSETKTRVPAIAPMPETKPRAPVIAPTPSSVLLHKLGSLYGTDKVARGILPFYDALFGKRREICQRILEIGVFFGASIRMWRDYFPNAEIHGADVFLGPQGNGHRFPEYTAFWNAWKRGCAIGAEEFQRVNLYNVDLFKRDELEAYVANQFVGTFDMVLDNGSNRMRDQQLCLGILFPLVKPGGYYVIEHLHSFTSNGYGALPDKSNASTLPWPEHYMHTQEFGSIASTLYMHTKEVEFLEQWIERIDVHRHGESVTCSVKRRCFPKAAPSEKKSALTRPGSLTMVNYSSTPHHMGLQVKHNRWARAFLKPDSILSYETEDLDRDFKTENKTILAASRGGGYWLWKPYVVLSALLTTDAEYVIYCDVHATTAENVNAWKARVVTQPMAGYAWPALELAYNKKKCLDTFGSLLSAAPDVLRTNQVVATFIMIRNTTEARDFVRSWLQRCLIDGVIDDSQRPGEKEAPGFIEHRHDQSVYSIFYKLAKFKSYPKAAGLEHKSIEWSAQECSLKITLAEYGVRGRGIVNVTTLLQELVRLDYDGKTHSLALAANVNLNVLFGDPTPGTPKMLFVDATFRSGAKKSFAIPEVSSTLVKAFRICSDAPTANAEWERRYREHA
jgi:hypothetical protein